MVHLAVIAVIAVIAAEKHRVRIRRGQVTLQAICIIAKQI